MRHALQLLRQLSLPEWRAHPWRHAVALLAVALGVALAFSVHLINGSALSEFSAAVRAANGEPDLTLRCAVREGCADSLLDTVAAADGVALATPVVEVDTYALPAPAAASAASAPGAPGAGRVALQVLGIDALQIAAVAPALLPRPADGQPRTAFLDPDRLFLNIAAQQRLGVQPGDALRLQRGLDTFTLQVAGSVAAGGGPLAVIDIAGAQQHFGQLGRLSRIDLRLAAGTSAAQWLQRTPLPPALKAAAADDAAQKVSSLSRAYRVNLTVLALVALFVGGFLVFSVLALSVAQRTPVFALLGVLGLGATERRRLVLLECLMVGVAGSAAGLLLGTGMAQLALRWLAGDLGGGYFPGVAPALVFSWPAAAAFGALGVVAALLEQSRWHCWSEHLHAWLVSLAANLLYAHSDQEEGGLQRSVKAVSLRSDGTGSATGRAFGGWGPPAAWVGGTERMARQCGGKQRPAEDASDRQAIPAWVVHTPRLHACPQPHHKLLPLLLSARRQHASSTLLSLQRPLLVVWIAARL